MADTSTRSGLLWEVERILKECEVKPQILLMENVTQVHGAGNDEHFKAWQLELEKMGYSNYWQDLSATEFGCPQTRVRTFMISILGNYNYNFPKKIPLELRLKDLLEPKVDEKYYLSERMINYVTKNNDKWTGNNDKSLINKQIASTINTGEGNRRCDASNYVSDLLPEEYDIKVIDSYNKKLTDPKVAGTLSTRQGSNQGSMIIERDKSSYLGHIENGTGPHQSNAIYDSETSSPCLSATDYKNPIKILIKNATKKGYLEATDGDGIDISSRMETHRGTVQKGMAQTITTMGGDNVGVVVKEEKLHYTEKSLDKIKKNVVDKEDIKPKVIGGVGEMKSNGGTQFYQQDRVYDGSLSISLATAFNPNYKVGLRIRKLTPKECFRLQGVKDCDSETIMKNQSNALGYHLAGDSICVTVLMAIFGELLGVDWKDYFKPEEWWKNGKREEYKE